MQAIFDALDSLHPRLLRAIHGIDRAELRRPEREGKWSIADVLAHVTDAELVTSARIHAILAEDAPRLIAFQQDRWARVHDGESIAELLEQMWSLRRSKLALLRRQPSAAFERTGVHAEYGPLTLRELLERHVEHMEKHLAQVERIKNALGLAHTERPFIEGLVSAAEGPAKSPGPGIQITELWRAGVHRALRVDFEPGAQWPDLDLHIPGPEEVYVLAGDLVDGAHRLTAGTFAHYPAGTSHQPHSEGGCSLFVFYPEG